MLDIKYIRENTDLVKKAVGDKQLTETLNIDELLELDKKYLDMLRLVEAKRGLRNQLSEDIAKVAAKEREKLIAEASAIKEDLTKLDKELDDLEANRLSLLKLVPNIIAPEVPFGKSEDENQVLESFGKPTVFDFEPKDHVELGELTNTINVKKSAEVSGARFNYLLGGAVQLQFALINYVFDLVTDEKQVSKLAKKVGNIYSNPFKQVLPPVLMKTEVMEKMDRLEPQEDRYVFEKDELVLVGSAEHTMGPMHMGETLDLSKGPLRYIGYSTAFRREAGSYGKDTRGILRLHQFDKLEFEVFSNPGDGQAEQDLLVEIQKHILHELKLPFQVIAICTGDMGKPDYKQIDMNTWIPTQETYRETHTSDYMTDYQSRRLGIKNEKGDFVHMNDATALAIGRILIAIYENFQRENGSIAVPKVLQKYTGFKEIKPTEK